MLNVERHDIIMKFWVVGFNKMHEVMWKDIEKLENAHYVQKIYTTNNKFLHFIRNKMLSPQINKGIIKRINKIWYKFYTLQNLCYDDKMNFILLTDGRPDFYQEGYLKDLKEKYPIKFVLVYLNSYYTSTEAVLKYKDICDYVFTYDKDDAEKYGFIYFPGIYSQIVLPNCSSNIIENDVLYVGSENGRLDTLLQCYERFTNGGLKAYFRITRVEKERQKYADEIIYNKEIPYEEVLKEVNGCNCILEVLNSKRKGTTLRAFEAVIFKKKLITNNENIVNMQFYNPQYMKVFKKVEDIDLEFIREREAVNYSYNNEYSPLRIIERICEAEAAEIE